MMWYLLAFVLMMVVPLGCAKNTAIQEAERAPATKYDQGGDARASNCQWIPCGTNAPARDNIIDANKLFVSTSQGQSFSLCEILLKSPTDVAIFQIAGLLCQSCQVEDKWVNSQNLSGISHYVIFTDEKNYVSGQDVNNFKQLAPKSFFFYDYDKKVANDLNYGKAFGTVLVLHKSGEYRLHLTPGLEQKWYNDARQLAAQQSTFPSYNQTPNSPIGSSNSQNAPYTPMTPQRQADPIYNYGFTY